MPFSRQDNDKKTVARPFSSNLLSVSCPSATEFSAILYFLPDQAQILLDHFNVLDEL